MSMSGMQMNVMDPNSFGDLKRLAREENSPEALRAAAKQFEALFLQMVLKVMREATPSNGMLDNDQTRMFQTMQDQQMAMNLAQGRGIGLADVLFRQLGGEALEKSIALEGAGLGANNLIAGDDERRFDLSTVARYTAIPAVKRSLGDDATAGIAVTLPVAATHSAIAANPAVIGDAAAELARSVRGGKGNEAVAIPEHVRAFVEQTWDHARDASRSTGIPAHFMIAQAALETGWGRAELRGRDGTPSHNLFNIKAGANWKGPVVELPVTEYANGRAYTENARFRSYGSYAEAFRDYVDLLRNSPRYAEVLGQQDAAGFARSLQSAGYATDPRYADKLTRIIRGASLRGAVPG